jgi:hypothetical protein
MSFIARSKLLKHFNRTVQANKKQQQQKNEKAEEDVISRGFGCGSSIPTLKAHAIMFFMCITETIFFKYMVAFRIYI